MARKKPDMTEGPILSRLILFALPIMATTVLQLLFNISSGLGQIQTQLGDLMQSPAVSCDLHVPSPPNEELHLLYLMPWPLSISRLCFLPKDGRMVEYPLLLMW